MMEAMDWDSGLGWRRMRMLSFVRREFYTMVDFDRVEQKKRGVLVRLLSGRVCME